MIQAPHNCQHFKHWDNSNFVVVLKHFFGFSWWKMLLSHFLYPSNTEEFAQCWLWRLADQSTSCLTTWMPYRLSPKIPSHHYLQCTSQPIRDGKSNLWSSNMIFPLEANLPVGGDLPANNPNVLCRVLRWYLKSLQPKFCCKKSPIDSLIMNSFQE